MRSFRSMIVSLVLVLAGCGAVPVDGVDDAAADGGAIISTAASYTAGDVGGMTLRNAGERMLGYNACTWTLERGDDGAWRTAPHEDERMCTMELRLLEPGRSVDINFSFDERLPAGEYRLRAWLERMESGGREHVLSRPFAIER